MFIELVAVSSLPTDPATEILVSPRFGSVLISGIIVYSLANSVLLLSPELVLSILKVNILSTCVLLGWLI